MITFRPKEESSDKPDLQAIYQEFKKEYPGLVDCSKYTIDTIKIALSTEVNNILLNKLLYNFPKESTTRDRILYGGITNNIPTNLSRHKIDKYAVCIFVDSFATAQQLESWLCSDLKLCIGKGGVSSAGKGGKNEGGDDDSRIVYIADMTLPGFEK